jgi:glycosyltransferase involved in cell wall biosynthesis
LFRAFAQIAAKYPGVDLVIAGAKGWKTEGIIETVVELGMQDRVHFLGFVPDEEIPSLFQHAKVAVTASLEEGFGLPVLEAMTFGSVVASSNSGALTEVGGEIPYYFDPLSLDSMVAGITAAIETKERDVRIAAGIERSKLFSWESSAKAVLGRIEMLVKK